MPYPVVTLLCERCADSLAQLQLLQTALGKAEVILGQEPEEVAARIEKAWEALAALHATLSSPNATQTAGR